MQPCNHATNIPPPPKRCCVRARRSPLKRPGQLWVDVRRTQAIHSLRFAVDAAALLLRGHNGFVAVGEPAKTKH
eukprot:COSAG05_NODE_14442_length_396_cov_1.212121_1_plen_73_part_10